MKKRFLPFLLAFLFLSISGCSAKETSTFKYKAPAYEAELKDVPVYEKTVSLANVKLTEDNLDWIDSAFAKYDDIFSDSYINFISLVSNTQFDAEWYDQFQNEATALQAKCSNFLKNNAPNDMKDMKTIADIQVIGLYNAIEQMKAAASTNTDGDFDEAKFLAQNALSEKKNPYDYLDSLYERYDFKMEVTSIKVKNGGKNMFPRFKNNETVTVTDFRFLVESQDKNGTDIQFEDAFDQLQCRWSSPDVKAGKTTSSNWYYKMGGFSGGYQYRIALISYTTSDGRVVVCKPDDYKWTAWTKP